MHVGTTQVAIAADEVKAALRINPLAYSKDAEEEAETYWRLVRLVATEADTKAVAEAVMLTLREQLHRLITERAVEIAMDIEEGEAQEKFDRKCDEIFMGGTL